MNRFFEKYPNLSNLQTSKIAQRAMFVLDFEPWHSPSHGQEIDSHLCHIVSFAVIGQFEGHENFQSSTGSIGQSGAYCEVCKVELRSIMRCSYVLWWFRIIFKCETGSDNQRTGRDGRWVDVFSRSLGVLSSWWWVWQWRSNASSARWAMNSTVFWKKIKPLARIPSVWETVPGFSDILHTGFYTHFHSVLECLGVI